MNMPEDLTWALIAWANQNHVGLECLPLLAAKAYALRQGPDAVKVIQHGYSGPETPKQP